jgi:hypothetical protein
MASKQIDTFHPCEVCGNPKDHPWDDCTRCGWTVRDLSFVEGGPEKIKKPSN